jgi:TPP-dependent pyruvate/acetoin dehydrogenase alpha subunit
LPVVFICENNLYSMGTPLYRSLSVADVSQKALGYGIARDRFDGEDVVRVRDRVAEAVRRARKLARKRAQREGLIPGKPKPVRTGFGGGAR